MFQVLVVENADEGHLQRHLGPFRIFDADVTFRDPDCRGRFENFAQWIKPRPICSVAPAEFRARRACDVRLYRGFSSATSMVIVASLASGDHGVKPHCDAHLD